MTLYRGHVRWACAGRWRRYAALPLLALSVSPFGCHTVGHSIPKRSAGVRAETTVQVASAVDKGDANPLTAIPTAAADCPIDLATALGQARVENPTIALAQEAIRASLAEQLQARALLLPDLNAGADVNIHRGNLESGQGVIRNVNLESVAVGSGVAAFGAGTVTIPGVRLFSHLADALYEPRVARQRVAARRFDATATDHSILLDVATRYFDLVGAEERLRAIRQSEHDLAEIVTLTDEFARSGQGRRGDADRAASEAQLMHAEELRAQEEVAVAAAELARLVNRDPSSRLRGDGGPIPLVQLIDPERPLAELIPVALQNRPELGAASAEIALRETRVRQETARPLLPLVSVGFSADGFGGSSNQSASRLGNLGGRTDFDVYAVWSLENFGLGNRATQRQRRAAVGEAVAELMRVENVIRREVADGYAQSAAARQNLNVARRQLQTAAEGYRLDLDRAKNLQGRPIELLNSVNLLMTARLEYLAALIGYDQAQFRLFVALGSPPTLALDNGVSEPRP